MAARPPMKPDSQLLPQGVAERLLARASELDAGSADVAQLRQAAQEAGISNAAFDAALAEIRSEKVTIRDEDAEDHYRPVRRFTALLIGIIVAAAVGLVVLRAAPSQVEVPANVVETTITLRCLTAAQAAGMVRPLLGSEGLIRIAPGAPRTLNLRGTLPQLERARALLEQRDGAAICALTPQNR
jgi:hypothetical protein